MSVWQQDSDPVSPSSGQKVNYQTDPRPHFGVACSSHSTCSSLWGSEGPCLGQRNQEELDQTDTCPHCHIALAPDTLRWHEVGRKFLKNAEITRDKHSSRMLILPSYRQSVCCLMGWGTPNNEPSSEENLLFVFLGSTFWVLDVGILVRFKWIWVIFN